MKPRSGAERGLRARDGEYGQAGVLRRGWNRWAHAGSGVSAGQLCSVRGLSLGGRLRWGWGVGCALLSACTRGAGVGRVRHPSS